MKKRTHWRLLTRAAAVAAVLAFVAWLTAAVWADTRKTLSDMSGAELYDYDAAANESVLKGPDDVLTLYFTPKRPHLNFIRVRMSVAQNADLSGCELSARLFDAQGEAISESTVDAESFSSGQYFTVWLDGGVETGKEYRVELLQTRGGGKRRLCILPSAAAACRKAALLAQRRGAQRRNGRGILLQLRR